MRNRIHPLRKWKRKSFWTAVIAMGLLASACSTNDEDVKKANPAGVSKSPDATAPANATTKPVEKLTLKWFTPIDQASSLLGSENDFVKKTIESKFNVQLNIEPMSFGGDRDKKLNVLISGNDMPDLMLTSGTLAQQYAIQGVLADLQPFVSAKTMPNYFKWIAQKELDQYKLEKKLVRIPVPYDKRVFRSFYVRKDWLEQVKLGVPKTYEEMINVMKAFTFNDPDKNGKNDTYGFTASGNGVSIPYDFPVWVHNDLIGGNGIQADKTFHDHTSDPKIENVINDLAGIIKLGVIDPDWFLNKGQTHIDSAARGKVGIVYGTTIDFAFDSNPNSLQSRTKAIIPNAQWVPFTPFADKALWREAIGTSSILISKVTADKQPEKVERSLQILDWLASEEGFLLTHYGQSGEHYTREGSKVTLKTDAIQKGIVDKGNFLDVYDFFTPNDPTALGLDAFDAKLTDRDRQIVSTFASYPKPLESIAVVVTPPTGFSLADFRNKLYEYHIKMLFDEKSGANWPKYRIEIMTKYGGQKMFEGYVEQMRAAGLDLKDFDK